LCAKTLKIFVSLAISGQLTQDPPAMMDAAFLRSRGTPS